MPPETVVEAVQMQITVTPRNLVEGRHAPEQSVEYPGAWIGVIVERIAPIVEAYDGCRLAYNDCDRVVIGQIDHIGFGRQDLDAVLAANHLLTFIGLEIARQPRSVPETFDRFQYVVLLSQNRIAERCSPLEIAAQQSQCLRIIQHRHNSRIPIIIQRVSLLRVGIQESLRFDQLQRIGRRRQQDSQNIVWIQSDGSDQVIEVSQ